MNSVIGQAQEKNFKNNFLCQINFLNFSFRIFSIVSRYSSLTANSSSSRDFMKFSICLLILRPECLHSEVIKFFSKIAGIPLSINSKECGQAVIRYYGSEMLRRGHKNEIISFYIMFLFSDSS